MFTLPLLIFPLFYSILVRTLASYIFHGAHNDTMFMVSDNDPGELQNLAMDREYEGVLRVMMHEMLAWRMAHTDHELTHVSLINGLHHRPDVIQSHVGPRL